MSIPAGAILDQTTALALREALRDQALRSGFTVAAFAAATPPPHSANLHPWLAAGRHGALRWLARAPEQRCDPRLLAPDIHSILCLGLNYRPPEASLTNRHDPDALGLAAYARGDDYHPLLRQRLSALAHWLEAQVGANVVAKLCVDAEPLLEKPLAAAAGLGWQGKNSLLVSPRHGCWLLLGELLLTLPLPADPPMANHCGRCTRCLDACPSNALHTPYQLDATRCLSCATIEAKTAIPRALRRALGNRVFGCDDCLRACPFNRFAPPTREPALLPRAALTTPRLLEFAYLDEERFQQVFANTPVQRTGKNRLLRSIAVALGNSRSQAALPALLHLLRHSSPLVRGHAAWGLGEHGQQALVWEALSHETDPGAQAEMRAVVTDAP